ncbi:hypothetical protein PL9214640559 [Planktothrix tepida PCC 9214]|uniref:Uncharacterized protein n=1 Tax=Planktothrix tepida PCC 9214 TaxID=671072 RepID=A0A1J1LPQ2_9CYAN|nr:hypothetical protein PL9214640559 [Planktothrix tepida PCC 9214]
MVIRGESESSWGFAGNTVLTSINVGLRWEFLLTIVTISQSSPLLPQKDRPIDGELTLLTIPCFCCVGQSVANIQEIEAGTHRKTG